MFICYLAKDDAKSKDATEGTRLIIDDSKRLVKYFIKYLERFYFVCMYVFSLNLHNSQKRKP